MLGHAIHITAVAPRGWEYQLGLECIECGEGSKVGELVDTGFVDYLRTRTRLIMRRKQEDFGVMRGLMKDEMAKLVKSEVASRNLAGYDEATRENTGDET